MTGKVGVFMLISSHQRANFSSQSFWTDVMKGSADEAATKLCHTTEKMLEEAYPLVKVSYKSTDPPWFNKELKS